MTLATTLVSALKTPQFVLAMIVASGILVIVVELVRRKKLREEYSVLWVTTAVVLIVLAIDKRMIEWLMRVTQAESAVSILYFGALVFLLLVAMQFSVRLTKLTFLSKKTNQQIALLEAEVERLREQLDDPTATRAEPRTEEPTVPIPRPGAPVSAAEKTRNRVS